MDNYQQKINLELALWKLELGKKPSLLDNFASTVQNKINDYIPQKVHDAVTFAIKQMTHAVLFGSKITTAKPLTESISLLHREALVKVKITAYCKTGAAEGGITGAGGFLMSMADFPILMSIKIKLLYEIAALYGHNTNDFKERIFILNIFQLAFSSKHQSRKVLKDIESWSEKAETLPSHENDFDWQTFQQEYRDYIDLAKLAQLLPVVGAAVGAVANYQLIKKLGKTAMMCYRMRLLAPLNLPK